MATKIGFMLGFGEGTSLENHDGPCLMFFQTLPEHSQPFVGMCLALVSPDGICMYGMKCGKVKVKDTIFWGYST